MLTGPALAEVQAAAGQEPVAERGNTMSLLHRSCLCARGAWLCGIGLWLGCGSTPTSTTNETAGRDGSPPTVSASAVASDASPSYLWSFDNLRLLVDANLVIQDSSSGNIVLQLPHSNSPHGDEWKTFDAGGSCCQQYTYSELDSLYQTATPAATDRITDASDLVLSWRLFGLLGKTVPTKRTLIVKRRGGSGHPAYALFDFVFPGPQ